MVPAGRLRGLLVHQSASRARRPREPGSKGRGNPPRDDPRVLETAGCGCGRARRRRIRTAIANGDDGLHRRRPRGRPERGAAGQGNGSAAPRARGHQDRQGSPGMTTYATDGQTRAALLDSQRRVLERIANGTPLPEILETLVRLIEEQAHGMRCAVLLADSQEQRLRFVAAPNIPEDYKAGIDPFLRIAPEMSSGGTAAFLREPVYTRDTA